MDNEEVVLSVDLDASETQESLEQITQSLEAIRSLAEVIGVVLIKSFTLVVKTVVSVQMSIRAMINELKLVTVEMSKLITSQGQLQQGGWIEGISAISDVCTIIQTLIVLMDALVIAKMKSRAEDMAIIALYAADYAVKLGQTIAQLAMKTAGWIAETAAKVANTAATVANTAAQWAAIAATTAWQAICTAATAVTTAFGAAMSFLTSPIGIAIAAITAIIAIIVLLVKNWDTVSAKAQEVWTFVQSKFAEFGAFLKNVFTKDWTEQFGVFGNILNVFFASVQNIWNSVKTIFNGIVSFVKSVFAGEWEAAWDSVKQIFSGIWQGLLTVVKGPVNGIIGFINAMVSGIVRGVNAIIGVLNGLKFTIPSWVPGFGGSSFGFNIRTLSAPQIPYLAQGAVLPANKPFMAVVGDQRHGTNVEAPLATIQEAVGLVMSEQLSAMVAGFQALLDEQRATRQAVESICIGDETIANAVDRHRHRKAMMCGF